MAIPPAFRKPLEEHDVTGIENLLRECPEEDKIAFVNFVVYEYQNRKYEIYCTTTLTDETRLQRVRKFQEQLVSMLYSLAPKDAVIDNFLQTYSASLHQKLVNCESSGSGPDGKPLDYYFCANNDRIGAYCLKPGILHCSYCRLVGYCSKECQKVHWKIHKCYCKNPRYRDDVWQPRWIQEGREPSFFDPSAPQAEVGMDLPLWGTTPAIDIIRFGNNEMKDGVFWIEKMNLAFIYSGDFRSLVETLASVPENFNGSLDIVINDLSPPVVARNLLMASLLLLEGDKAIDTVISVWYSYALPQFQYLGPITNVLRKLLPMYEEGNCSGKLEHGCSVIELSDLAEPLMILFHMDQNEVDVQDALRLRNSITLNPSGRDYFDRRLFGLRRFHRESFDHFQNLGLLLPYECFFAHHDHPNKFLLSSDHGWLLSDTADLKRGWDMIKVMKFGDEMKLPPNDLYGRLFFYIRDRLSKMVATIRRAPTTIRFFQKDTKDLAMEFQSKKLSFDRIDVSIACDENHLGIERVLNEWAPLLKKSNPNSAIISLFLNWFDGNDIINICKLRAAPGVAERAEAWLGALTSVAPSPFVAAAKDRLMFDYACHINADNSKMFQKHLENHSKSKPNYLKRRMGHKIVPHRVMFPLDAKPNATAQSLSIDDQYSIINSFNFCGRYVEWELG